MANRWGFDFGVCDKAGSSAGIRATEAKVSSSGRDSKVITDGSSNFHIFSWFGGKKTFEAI
jgi:hypothetical protein